MDGTFAQGARRLFAVSARAFGWTPDVFWAATPAELAAALDWPEARADAPLSRAEFNALMERECDG